MRIKKIAMYQYKAIKVNGKKIDEHRHMMQEHLGRKLSKNEIVHHKNNVKRDNFIENFEIKTRSEHMKLHVAKGDIKAPPRQRSHNSGGYRLGCRCAICTEAHRIRIQEYRKK